MRLRRVASGAYVADRAIDGAHFRIERDWGEPRPGTDRRRQSWVLLRITPDGEGFVADVLSDHRTLADARIELGAWELRRR